MDVSLEGDVESIPTEASLVTLAIESAFTSS